VQVITQCHTLLSSEAVVSFSSSGDNAPFLTIDFDIPDSDIDELEVETRKTL